MKKWNLMQISAVLILLTTSGILAGAEGNDAMIDKTRSDLWKDGLADQYSNLVKYANFPMQQILDHKLPTEDYKGIVSQFYRWTCHNLRPEYCPSEQLLRENLCLIKAKHFEDKKGDVAYFGDIDTKAGGEIAKIRVVQTCPGTPVYFFIKYPDLPKVVDRNTARDLIDKSLDVFFKNSDEIKALIADVSEENGTFTIVKKTITNWEYQFQSFQGFVHENVICIYFSKTLRMKDAGNTPPNQPGRNEWFDWGHAPQK